MGGTAEKISEAVALYLEGEDMDIPKPAPLEILAQRPDYEGGVWMTVDIDLSCTTEGHAAEHYFDPAARFFSACPYY